MAFPLSGTIARKKKTLDNLMCTIQKVCEKDIIPKPKKIKYDSDNEDYIVSKTMKHSHDICQEVCTYEDENYSRKR